MADVEPGAKWVPFGPFDDEMPSGFRCHVTDTDFPVDALIRLAFDGNEVTCEAVEFRRREDGPRSMPRTSVGCASAS